MEQLRLQDLFSDNHFVNQLFSLDDANDVQKLMETKGVSLSIDDINQTKDFLIRYQNDELTSYEKNLLNIISNGDQEQLDDEQLELVNGGCVGIIIGIGILSGILAGMIGYTAYDAVRRRW